MPKRARSVVDGRNKRRQSYLSRTQLQQHVSVIPQYLGRQFPPNVADFSVGQMNLTCHDCQTLRFPGELHNCCHNGKVTLAALAPYPPELTDLITHNDFRSQHFLKNIRQYNSAMAFASFGAKLDIPTGYGPYTFRLHGQIYHQSGSLHPPDGTAPCYSQLYILEGDEAVSMVRAHLNRKANDSPCGINHLHIAA